MEGGVSSPWAESIRLSTIMKKILNKTGMCLMDVSRCGGGRAWTESALRRVGRAESGAGRIRAAVVAEGAGSVTVDHAPVWSLQHAWLEVGVTACMLHKMVTPHEALVTQRASKLLLPSVGTVVARQLV